MHLAAQSPGQPEVFRSIQGEGASLGAPSIFVRLARCNLHCWWCDTAYTWDFEGTPFEHRDDQPGAPKKYKIAEEVIERSVEAVAETVIALETKRVIFTGGEPMLQARALGELAEKLIAADPDYHLEIETNGTIAPPDTLARRIDQFNVSPKLGGSRNETELRLKPDVLTRYAEDARAFFKFVIANEDDLDEVDRLIELFSLERDRVFLMPEGVDAATLTERGKWVSAAAIARSVNFTPRLHIHLYGDERGV